MADMYSGVGNRYVERLSLVDIGIRLAVEVDMHLHLETCDASGDL